MPIRSIFFFCDAEITKEYSMIFKNLPHGMVVDQQNWGMGYTTISMNKDILYHK